LVNGEAIPGTISRLSRTFKVSSLVVLRRLHDAGVLDRQAMGDLYRQEVALLARRKRTDSGGDFYASHRARVGRRFARAVYTSAWEGRCSFTEAFRLLNIRRMDTFHKLGAAVGAAP
jgi:Zn-dependent peptidase ImmA (M78 family)